MAVGNSITVNTDQVKSIADKMDEINKKLREELDKTKVTIDGLANIWQSEAARATIDSYDKFAQNYFQLYEDVMKQYSNFLRTNVQQGYESIENDNIRLADVFKG
ncbi:MAG: WXG100 family type VII secretion target [Lachnospiraceae bacterium]|nr:WXG100 family type VII secretion target [Lachnospiraceae bacterium]